MTLITRHLSEPYKSISYREAGLSYAGKASPVVLIHGVGMQSAAWEPQLRALGATRHVIALDMPGHGESTSLPEGSLLIEFVAWLDAVLDHLSLGCVNLVGHSMGALIAGGYAVDHSERLERVALLNGVFRREANASAAVIERAAEISKGAFDLETPLARWFADTPSENAARADVRKWLSMVDIKGYSTAYNAFARGDTTFADGFLKIDCPLLALTGDGDQNSSPAMSQAMADAAPKGYAVIIENHRHMVNLTAPDAVNAALKEWLQTPLEEMDAA